MKTISIDSNQRLIPHAEVQTSTLHASAGKQSLFVALVIIPPAELCSGGNQPITFAEKKMPVLEAIYRGSIDWGPWRKVSTLIPPSGQLEGFRFLQLFCNVAENTGLFPLGSHSICAAT